MKYWLDALQTCLMMNLAAALGNSGRYGFLVYILLDIKILCCINPGCLDDAPLFDHIKCCQENIRWLIRLHLTVAPLKDKGIIERERQDDVVEEGASWFRVSSLGDKPGLWMHLGVELSSSKTEPWFDESSEEANKESNRSYYPLPEGNMAIRSISRRCKGQNQHQDNREGRKKNGTEILKATKAWFHTCLMHFIRNS